MNSSEIFDAVLAAGKIAIMLELKHSKELQIQSLTEKRCGNCFHWMKSSCKPEKERGEFKSMSSFGCDDFHLDAFVDIIEKLEAEVKEIEAKLVES